MFFDLVIPFLGNNHRHTRFHQDKVYHRKKFGTISVSTREGIDLEKDVHGWQWKQVSGVKESGRGKVFKSPTVK